MSSCKGSTRFYRIRSLRAYGAYRLHAIMGRIVGFTCLRPGLVVGIGFS